jgi:hypothetical protein
MTNQTPDQIAAHWAQQMGAATAKATAGAQGVQVPPGQAAARQKAVYVQNVTAKADKWAANVAAVSLQEWQQAFIQKGIPRIASGATASQPKFAAFMGKLLPYQANALRSLPARGSLDQNIARSNAWIRTMANFSK